MRSSGGRSSLRRHSNSSGSGRSSSSGSSSRPVERNATAEMIKVVVGGLLAIPIAYLLVFWIFKKDPLNVGPTLGNVVPFMVPADLRDDDSESEATAENPEVEETDIGESDDLAVPELDPNRVLNPDLHQ